MPSKKDPRLTKNGLSGYNKPKATPNHPKKSHVVLAKEGDKVKLIRFGQQESAVPPKRLGSPRPMLLGENHSRRATPRISLRAK